MKYLVLIACILYAVYCYPDSIRWIRRGIDRLNGSWTDILDVQTKLGEVKVQLNYRVAPCAMEPWWERKAA